MPDSRLPPPFERRAHLTGDPNPDTRLDYLVEIKGSIAVPGSPKVQATVVLRYVPDKLVIKPETFGQYLRMVEAFNLPTLEALASVILEDLNNELVARWLQVTVTSPSVHAGVQSHAVMLEDRQPSWENVALMARIRRY
jgi:7-cyano-7-deazaguanine reductase